MSVISNENNTKAINNDPSRPIATALGRFSYTLMRDLLYLLVVFLSMAIFSIFTVFGVVVMDSSSIVV